MAAEKAAIAYLHQGIYLILSGPPRTLVPAGIAKAAGTEATSWSEKLPSHSQCICLKTGENLVFALSKIFQKRKVHDLALYIKKIFLN